MFGIEARRRRSRIGTNLDSELFRVIGLNFLGEAAETTEVKVTQLLKEGANPNSHLANGMTPLFGAIHNNKISLVRLLLKFGADPELRGPEGETPSYLAFRLKRKEIFHLLQAEIFLKEKETEGTVLPNAVKEQLREGFSAYSQSRNLCQIL